MTKLPKDSQQQGDTLLPHGQPQVPRFMVRGPRGLHDATRPHCLSTFARPSPSASDHHILSPGHFSTWCSAAYTAARLSPGLSFSRPGLAWSGCMAWPGKQPRWVPSAVPTTSLTLAPASADGYAPVPVYLIEASHPIPHQVCLQTVLLFQVYIYPALGLSPLPALVSHQASNQTSVHTKPSSSTESSSSFISTKSPFSRPTSTPHLTNKTSHHTKCLPDQSSSTRPLPPSAAPTPRPRALTHPPTALTLLARSRQPTPSTTASTAPRTTCPRARSHPRESRWSTATSLATSTAPRHQTTAAPSVDPEPSTSIPHHRSSSSSPFCFACIGVKGLGHQGASAAATTSVRHTCIIYGISEKYLEIFYGQG